MSVSFFSPSRCVLLIGDDAVHVFDVKSSKTNRVKTVMWSDEDFVDNVIQAIDKHCAGKPIIILHDMVEQYYRKEKIPNIGALDKVNVVQRRLSVAFPTYPVRAALPLKERGHVDDGSTGSGSVYLFAAIPSKTISFANIVSVVRNVKSSVTGLFMLPVESSSLVKQIAEKIFFKKSDAKRSKWTIFIGQHYGGGLRQIVIRDGELALTRLTPIVDTDSKPELWAAEVAQEFKATMSYLSRFGYSTDEGLNVILIANPKAGEIVGDIIDAPCEFKNLTSVQAGALLGISIGVQEDMRYADPLHAAWSGKKVKYNLPLKSAEINAIAQPRKIATALMAILVLGLGYLTYDISDKLIKYNNKSMDLSVVKQAYAQVDDQHSEEIKRKEALGIDVKKIQSSLSVHEGLQNDGVEPLPIFQVIGQKLGGSLKLDDISIYQIDKTMNNNRRRGAAKETKSVFEARMSMSFAGDIKPEDGNEVANAFRKRLSEGLPAYKVFVSKSVQDLSHQGVLEDTLTLQGSKNKKTTKKYTAEIMIKGEIGNE